MIAHSNVYLACAFFLLVVGVLDDKYDVSFKVRLVIQLLVTVVMMVAADLNLISLGSLFNSTELNLGLFGYIFTPLIVVGAINAFNMVDGIDGLLGALSTITFASLAVLFYYSGNHNLYVFSLVIVCATIPYICMNLGIPFGQRYKVFMGDAGSTVIGFTVVWLLILGTKGKVQGVDALSPVTALWISAVPILDAVTTIIRRLRKGQSPFKPDREHLHHILMRLGFNSSYTLVVITILSAGFAFIGVISHINQVPEYIMFYSFILVLAAYFYIISHIWNISVKLRKVFKNIPQASSISDN